jgi:hypothetical protein
VTALVGLAYKTKKRRVAKVTLRRLLTFSDFSQLMNNRLAALA